MQKSMMYKAVYADEEFEVFSAKNDEEAFKEAHNYEEDHGDLFDLLEIDPDIYDEIRTIF